MRAFGRIIRGIFPACGAVALLVLFGAVPAARAACGDYVTVVRPADHPAHDQSQPIPQPAAPACHGPGCSATPVQAGAIAPPKPIERPSLDLTADPVAPDADASARAAHGPDRLLGPTPLTADIFHPPRAR
jgi:hypothetical protein